MKNRSNRLALFAAFVAALSPVLLHSTARAELVYGLSTAGVLSSFNSTSPGTQTTIGAVSNIAAGQTLVSIDVRPATGQIYGLGYNPTGTIGQLYTIDATTGVATAVGGTVVLAGAGTGLTFDIDFNPTVDRIRVLGGLDTNFRLNPNDGTLVATDTTLTPASVAVYAAAYTFSVSNLTLPTTLYGYDFTADNLLTVGSIGGTPNSPNGGVTTVIGNAGIVSSGSSSMGFDISGVTGLAYLQTATSANVNIDSLYTINLATGATTLVGAFPADFRDIAVAVPEPGTYAMLALGLGLGALVVRRRRPVTA